jgi:putative transposase
MIDREHQLPLKRQAKLLGLSRSTLYRRPKGPGASTLALMRRIDEKHTAHPTMGARRLRAQLRLDGVEVGRRRVRTLMQRMGIEAIYRAPRTTTPNPEHQVFPYLLRGRTIDRVNQVWAMDITYIPMARGFCYLAVVMDWYSRKVLAHEVSITMEADFCVRAMESALQRYGRPEIVNTDQGSQFASAAFTKPLLDAGIAISMDGRGAWRDNVMVERLWRTVKYEEVYLRAYDTVAEGRRRLGAYLEFYNTARAHSSLNGTTPDAVYFGAGLDRAA